jgi:hypothetical protein
MTYRYQGNDYTLPEAVKKAVSGAGRNDFRNGRMELMQAQIDKLAEMVAMLVSAIDTRSEILHWTEVETEILGYDWSEVRS